VQVNGQPRALAAIILIPSEYEAGWMAIWNPPYPWWNTNPHHSTCSLVQSEEMFPLSETCRLVLQPNQLNNPWALGLVLKQEAAKT